MLSEKFAFHAISHAGELFRRTYRHNKWVTRSKTTFVVSGVKVSCALKSNICPSKTIMYMEISYM
jgi:hypothetical protein